MPSQADDAAISNGDGTVESVSKMAIYGAHKLALVHATIDALAAKPKWSLADTESFDYMHYNGHAALDTCAAQLRLAPAQHVLDVGSGFGSTGRYLATAYGARVTGIELQEPVHRLAVLVTARNEDPRVAASVRSVQADFLTLSPADLGVESADDRFDHVVSILCVTHMPEEARPVMFAQAAAFLKPGGYVYIEDFYRTTPGPLPEREQRLQRIAASSCLPTQAEWVDTLTGAGFEDIQFQDVSAEWKPVIAARAADYRASEERNPDLETFYDSMVAFLDSEHVGGVRLRATRR